MGLIPILTLAAALQAQGVEMRGVWLTPPAIAPDRAEQTLRSIERANLNTLFVRAPDIVSAYGVNKGAGQSSHFDLFIREARSRGLAVHAWLANKWRGGLDQAPFTQPAERDAQVTWALTVLERYPMLDGVHFDYIRYTKWAPPDAQKMAAIADVLRRTKQGIARHHPGRFLTAAVFIARYSYMGQTDRRGGVSWEGDVPQWYRDWYRRHPTNYFARQPTRDHAAGLFKDHRWTWRYGPTFMHYQQDPVAWLHDGIIDGVMPMQYTADTDDWKTEVDVWSWMTGRHFNRVYMGLGWLTEKGHDDWRRDAPALTQHVRAGRMKNLPGTCLFALGLTGVDDRPIVEALGGPDGPFFHPARSPLKRPAR